MRLESWALKMACALVLMEMHVAAQSPPQSAPVIQDVPPPEHDFGPGVEERVLRAEPVEPEFNRKFPTSSGNGGASSYGRFSSPAAYTGTSGLSGLRRSSGVLWNPPKKAVDRSKLKVGPVRFRAHVGLNAEFNDNIAQSDDNRKADLILRPEFGLEGYWQITDYNSLRLQLTFAYEKYLFHSDQDRAQDSFLVLPEFEEPAIQLNAKVKNVYITIFDTPILEQDFGSEVTLNASKLFRRFVNIAGIRARWDLNDVQVTAGYTRVDQISLTSEFDYLDSSIDQFSGEIMAKVSDSVVVGWMADLAFINYRDNVLNDGTSFRTGPVVNWKPSRFIDVSAVAGYQNMSFSSGGEIQDTSDQNGVFADVTINHRLNRMIRHQLSLGHEAQFGTNSNFVEVTYVRHQVDWSLFNWISLGTYAFFEHAKESGGRFAQDINRFGFGLAAGYNFSPQAGISAYYTFISRDTSGRDFEEDALGAEDYYQNRVGITFRYSF